MKIYIYLDNKGNVISPRPNWAMYLANRKERLGW